MDWGSERIKLVEVISQGGDFYLHNFLVKKTEPFDFSTSYFKQMRETLNLFFKEQSFSTYEINLLLSGSDLIIKVLNLPLVKLNELKELILWEAQDITADSVKNLITDYKILEKNQEQIKVLLVITYKTKLLRQIKLLEEVGFKVNNVKAAPLMLNNLLDAELKQKKLVIIDIGAQVTELLFFKKGKFAFRRVLNFGGQELTTTIQQENNLTKREAEQLKYNRDLKDNSFSNFLIKLIKKIELSIHYWEQQGEKIEFIYLTGGGAKLKGLKQYLKKELGVEVKMLTGFSQFEFTQNNCSFHFLREQIPYLTISLAGVL